MKRVYKYSVSDDGKVWMPVGAKILKADFQNVNLMLWALVDPEEVDVPGRELIIAGTGHDIDESLNLEFIDTVFTHDLVFHVFEIIN